MMQWNVTQLAWIAAGGAAGSTARFLLASGLQRAAGGLFPIGTLAVNVLGCLAIGFLNERLEASVVSANVRMGLLIGVLGGFTTFSTFGLETMSLLEKRELPAAMGNIVVTVLACLVACWAGQRIARGLLT